MTRPDLAGASVLVSGGAGFVGANLIAALTDAGATVHAVVRDRTDRWRLEALRAPVQVHDADLADASAVLRIVSGVRPDIVLHLAKHRGDPATADFRRAYRDNLDATLNLLEAVRVCPVARFVHAGSSLEYDLTRSPLRESDAPAPATIHGVTKAAAAQLVQHYGRHRGVPAIVLRLFTVYGPWEGAARFVPSVMLAALDDQPVRVAAGRVHDWIFVGDVVDACLAASSPGVAAGEIINIGTGTQSSNDDVVLWIEGASGKRILRDAQPFRNRVWDSDRWVADGTKARELMGWSAHTTLRDGLARTWTWFCNHHHLYRSAHR